MRVSVILTTYNRPDALTAVLAGLAAQTDRYFEVVIADDGSGDPTLHAIGVARAAFPVPLSHVWQEDAGFRAAAARNRAVAQAQGDYLVFLDGDCIPRPDFIARHRKLAEAGWFVAGNRILLSAELTARILASAAPAHRRSMLGWLGMRAKRGINRWLPLLHLPGQAWRKTAPERWRGARTCNMAVWRRDFVAVNGFDEAYAGWGHEDADLAIRLIRAGIRRKDGRYATAVFHLWHRESDRSALPENERRLVAILAATHTRAQLGLDQYTQAPA